MRKKERLKHSASCTCCACEAEITINWRNQSDKDQWLAERYGDTDFDKIYYRKSYA